MKKKLSLELWCLQNATTAPKLPQILKDSVIAYIYSNEEE